MEATKSWFSMTPQERINEAGNEPDCPFCGKPRVTRSTYIRCNRCGVNWSPEDNLFGDPRMRATKPIEPVTDDGVQTAK